MLIKRGWANHLILISPFSFPDGNWLDWGEWGACSASSKKQRVRKCAAAEFGGKVICPNQGDREEDDDCQSPGNEKHMDPLRDIIWSPSQVYDSNHK